MLMSVPFGLLFARTAVRSGWALIGEDHGPTMATVGFVRPWIVFSPHLAKKLNDRQVEAALQHERAHACHRDPLRIWLAQLATDLQWPWPQARERLQRWLIALELARDEEARVAGTDGTDLAEAILTSARFTGQENLSMQAALIGEPSTLKERIQHLLRPLPSASGGTTTSSYDPLLMLVPVLTLALAAGAIFGERLIRALFWIAA
jgi:beta-lactamase regulating signal transducer with metallopeptidase domain